MKRKVLEYEVTKDADGTWNEDLCKPMSDTAV